MPHLLKADIDAAYHRIPIMPEHRWEVAVTFMHEGRIWVVQHVSMPFGATSLVHAWDRAAKLILKIARVLLKLSLLA